ncbi:MAG: ROK family protein [Peptoniphilaceae bacterium]|nr:ROK family protein [Peptoniphilaceae bacterium]MDY6018779.1 ROK family protein [Anaerococcus sp.]
MKVICFDIGGTAIKSMLIENGKEKSVDEIKSRAKEGANYLKEDIFKKIKELLKENKDLAGVAISTAGMVDYKTGIISYANENIKNYIGFDWIKEVKEEFNLPCLVENDVKAAALGEANFGAGKNYKTSFVLTIGTGLGGALIIDKKIYRGSSGSAGEIGYLPFYDSTIEKKASTSAIIELASLKYPEKNFRDGKILFEAFKNKDQAAIDLIDTLTTNLAKLLATIMLIISPEAIIIGGGISKQKDKLLDPLRLKTKELVPANIYKATAIINTELANKSGCYGVYHLFTEKF